MEWNARPLVERLGFGTTLLLAMSMAPVLQYAIAALAPFLVAELGLSRTQIGSFTSVLFVVAALTAPQLGHMVDRFGGRAVLALLFGVNALAIVLAGIAGSFWLLMAAAVATGVPMAAANPATNAIIRGEVPDGARGLLMGLKQSGVTFAQVFSSLLVPPLAVWLGWRMATLSLVLVAAWGLVMTWRYIPAGDTLEGGNQRSGVPVPRFFWWLAAYGLAMGAGQGAFNGFLPLYGHEALSLTPTAAGTVAAVTGLTGAISRIAWARKAERIQLPATALMLIAAGGAVAVTITASAPLFGVWVLVCGAILFGASAPVWNVVAMLAVLRLAGPRMTGAATGVVFLGFSTGFIIGPFVFGALVDRTDTYELAWMFSIGTYLTAALIALGIRRFGQAPLKSQDPFSVGL